MCKIVAHFRRAHMVKGHFRNTRYGRVYISAHMRNGSWINSHCK